ncbi:hypothetical protein NUW58_g6924 [Xylaria curta]|uniref:Uncharacterized protein n=1 Tax=Xylaria curta TaxID=42375 RepID=A0ACC1NNP0_9PEZI|nr:hypothetical protein NUW58_g6924 [Xylaria curta]
MAYLQEIMRFPEILHWGWVESNTKFALASQLNKVLFEKEKIRRTLCSVIEIPSYRVLAYRPLRPSQLLINLSLINKKKMRLISIGVALAVASSRAILAAADGLPTPPLPPWYPLLPWEISSISTRHPYERPYSANTSSMLVTIRNPKAIAAVPAPHASGGGYVVFRNSSAECELHWKTDAFTPYGHSSNSCVTDVRPNDYSNPKWSITLNELHTDLSSPGDYYISVSFSLSYNGTIYATQGYKLMSGGTSFRTSKNLEGQCVEGGLCEYKLREELSPALFQPTLQECKSACG